jgi:hypothetical protein
LSELFESYKDVKYALLIIEADKSFLARKVHLNKIFVYELLEFITFLKLMLDFEPFEFFVGRNIIHYCFI